VRRCVMCEETLTMRSTHVHADKHSAVTTRTHARTHTHTHARAQRQAPRRRQRRRRRATPLAAAADFRGARKMSLFHTLLEPTTTLTSSSLRIGIDLTCKSPKQMSARQTKTKRAAGGGAATAVRAAPRAATPTRSARKRSHRCKCRTLAAAKWSIACAEWNQSN